MSCMDLGFLVTLAHASLFLLPTIIISLSQDSKELFRSFGQMSELSKPVHTVGSSPEFI